jgi:EmrB/QacA subfamily drug resistance transporter
VQRPRRPWLSLLVLCLGTFAILLDTTIVNVALPNLITQLHASLDQALWVVNSYLLVFCALLIVAGRLGDMLGPRRLFTAGLAVFALASAACGAAQSPGQLIAARIVQGIGAAALTPQALVIIRAIFPPQRMGAAFGMFSSMVGVAAVTGPVLGGVLTTYLSWRWVFYVNLPVAATGIALAFLVVPEIRAGQDHRLDVPGVALAGMGLAAVTYGLIEGQRHDWGTVAVGITIPEIIVAGVVVLAGFVAWEQRHREPLVPLGLFRDRTFTIMVALNVVVQFALQSMLLVNSINLQSVLGFTAAMRARAVADAGALPPAARPAFGTDLVRSAKAGLQVGRGQPIVPMPAGTRPSLIGQLEHLYADVFTHGYITAMGPTLAVSVALLLAGAAACLLLRRHPAPLPGADAAAEQAARAVPAATAD